MRLYKRYFLIHLKSQMQYKASFFMTFGAQFISSFTAFFAIYFMFSRFNEVEGFTFTEVLLCFSVVLSAFSLAESFARGFDHFATMIGNGEFDRILLRPRNLIIQVLGSTIDFTRLGRLFQSLVVLLYAIPKSGIEWTFTKAVLLFLMIICGAVVFTGLFIIYASVCFFTTEGLEVMNIFTDGGREFGRYPFSVYGKNILLIFTFIVPLALFQYYPLLYLIGRSDNILYFFSPLISTLFLIPCLMVWKIGLRHYKSTGS